MNVEEDKTGENELAGLEYEDSISPTYKVRKVSGH